MALMAFDRLLHRHLNRIPDGHILERPAISKLIEPQIEADSHRIHMRRANRIFATVQILLL
jgi:hypothetical protein